ncbi:MAG: hypothetical protein R3C15_06920 [Thermoleophilia bacterium]
MTTALASAASLPVGSVGSTIVGLLELLGWLLLVLALAGGTTYVMVKVTDRRNKAKQAADAAKAAD